MKWLQKKYFIIIALIFFILIKPVSAATIRETLINGDGYDTIEPGTFIIGITKFPGTEIITASKASIAGANDAMFYAAKNGTTRGYKAPTIYYYVDSNVGWFEFDSNNNAKAVTDRETLDKLSKIDIYYVSNVEKRIQVSYPTSNINTNSLGEGLEVVDDALYADATLLNFEIETNDGKTISFMKDEITSEYIRDTQSCYTTENGVILDYDSTCGSDITIPSTINNEVITEIAANAFNNKNLNSVVVPSSVVTIGDGAFSNNTLENITFDGKYDSTDFVNLSSTAFDTPPTITYNNDLTATLNSLPNSYKLKVYSGLDLSDYNTDILIRNAFIKEVNSNNYNFHIETSELYKYYNIHYYLGGGNAPGQCYDHSETGFDIYFGLNENNRYSIFLQKRANNCTRIITVDKEITLEYEKTGNLVDKLSIESAFNNINKITDSIDEEIINNSSIVTKRKYIEDFVDNNNLEYLYDDKRDIIIEPESDSEIGGSLSTGDLFIFKNDILYQVVEKISIVNVSNAYFPELSYDDYNDPDTFSQALLTSFENKTGITNYNFLTLASGKKYHQFIEGANRVFYISVFDNESLEYWSIYSKSTIDSTFNEMGYTPGDCFTIEEGTIMNYNGACGVDVKIPSIINSQIVKRINDNTFYNYGIRSIELPNNLEFIGTGAFYQNNLTTVNIPNAVKEIGIEAFAKNKLTSITLPNNLEALGDGAFTNNQMPASDAIIYSRDYDSNEGRTVINPHKINSYAGKNRNNITIPSTITAIGPKAFQGLGLDEITIPYGIKSIGYYAFEGNNLTQISIPDSIEFFDWGVFANNKFSGNNSFIYLRDENGNIDKSTLMNYSIYIPKGSYKYEINRIEIPSTVKKIWENAFSNVYSIYTDELIIPYGVEDIGNYAFASVYFKNKITLPKSIKNIGMGLFIGSYGLSEDKLYVYAREENGTIDDSILMAYVGDGYANNQKVTIPENVRKIGKNAFSTKYMKQIVFNNQLEEIGERAFYNNYYLESINIPSSVKKIGNSAFAGSNITSITLNEGLEEIGEDAFDFPTTLNSISIPSTVRKIGNNAFGYVPNVIVHGKSSAEEFEDGFYLDGLGGVNIQYVE